jgi:hypothetical protein
MVLRNSLVNQMVPGMQRFLSVNQSTVDLLKIFPMASAMGFPFIMGGIYSTSAFLVINSMEVPLEGVSPMAPGVASHLHAYLADVPLQSFNMELSMGLILVVERQPRFNASKVSSSWVFLKSPVKPMVSGALASHTVNTLLVVLFQTYQMHSSGRAALQRKMW